MESWAGPGNEANEYLYLVYQVAEAQEVFGHMQNERVTPEVPLFNSLIAGYGRQGDIRTAFKLFNNVSFSCYLALVVTSLVLASFPDHVLGNETTFVHSNRLCPSPCPPVSYLVCAFHMVVKKTSIMYAHAMCM